MLDGNRGMANRRKRKATSALADLSLLQLLINPVSLMIVVAIATIPLWNRYHDRLDINGRQFLTADHVHLNERPPWIRTSVRESAIRDSRLNEIALEQPNSLELVAAALAVQPWVKSVQNVRKTAAGVFANVIWRQPVAIVEFANDLVIPIDQEAVVLEGDGLRGEDTVDLWRISVPEPLTSGLASGRTWEDMRIQDAAAIAVAWQSRHREPGLMRVVNRSYPTGDRVRLQPYELWTAGGAIVYWGSPPGHELTGEATAEQKIAAVEEYVRKHGALDQADNLVLDVRDGTARLADSTLAELPVDFIKLLK